MQIAISQKFTYCTKAMSFYWSKIYLSQDQTIFGLVKSRGFKNCEWIIVRIRKKVMEIWMLRSFKWHAAASQSVERFCLGRKIKILSKSLQIFRFRWAFSGGVLQRQKRIVNLLRQKSSSKNLSNENKHWCFCCL